MTIFGESRPPTLSVAILAQVCNLGHSGTQTRIRWQGIFCSHQVLRHSNRGTPSMPPRRSRDALSSLARFPAATMSESECCFTRDATTATTRAKRTRKRNMMQWVSLVLRTGQTTRMRPYLSQNGYGSDFYLVFTMELSTAKQSSSQNGYGQSNRHPGLQRMHFLQSKSPSRPQNTPERPTDTHGHR